MNEELSKQIKDLEQRQRQIADELEALRNPVVEPWEPSGGGWTVFLEEGHVEDLKSNEDYAKAGLEFKTKEEAEAALKAYRFYTRLYKLACEVNPSGKAGGDLFVFYHEKDQTWKDGTLFISHNICKLFETSRAAKEACKIMNRDNWQFPYGEEGK